MTQGLGVRCVNLGSLVNTDKDDRCPSLTPDMRIFMFDSERAGGYGSKDLWWVYYDTIRELGIQLTPLTPTYCVRLTCLAANHAVIWGRFHVQGLLYQPIEQLAPRTGFSPIESEREFIQVVIQMVPTHRPLVSSQQPAFEQSCDPMNPREQLDGSIRTLSTQNRNFMTVSIFLQAAVALPSIGMHDTGATTTIPIVIGQVSDPVGLGFVASLERPGGNITGLTTSASDISGKRLALVKETFPVVTRVALLLDARNPAHKLFLRAMEAAAPALGVQQVQALELRRLDDIDNAFQAAMNGRAEAVIETAAGIFITNQDRERLVTAAIRARLPVFHQEQAFVLAGGLMSYGTDIPELFRRAATYVDKILKGAKPADLPVEQPTKIRVGDQPPVCPCQRFPF